MKVTPVVEKIAERHVPSELASILARFLAKIGAKE